MTCTGTTSCSAVGSTITYKVAAITNGSSFNVVFNNIKNQISLNTACCGNVQVKVIDGSGNEVAKNLAVTSVPPTTTAATATGTLSNNGFDDPSIPANYTFTLNLVNAVPSGGKIEI